MSQIQHLSIFFIAIPCLAFAGTTNIKDSLAPSKYSIYVGLRAQKAVGFYWSNGFSGEFASQSLFNKSLAFGMTIISSKLGTAAFSNAIPCYEINAAVIRYFRMSKALKTDLRLNAGYAHANYGSENFGNLPNHSITASLEFDVAYDFKFPLRAALGGGFNLITGNGAKGLGTLYPLYWQFSLLYQLINL